MKPTLMSIADRIAVEMGDDLKHARDLLQAAANAPPPPVSLTKHELIIVLQILDQRIEEVEKFNREGPNGPPA